MCEAHPATTDNHTVSAPGNRPGAGPLRVRRVALRHGPVETGSMIIAFSVQPSGEPSDPKLARDVEPGSDSAGVHDAVAAAVRVVREAGLPHRPAAMFTEIEGEWGEVMGVGREATIEGAGRGARVSLVLKGELRPGPAR